MPSPNDRLCGGYFRDAHTITECLHTFCKSCLLKSFAAGNTTCPHCAVSLGPHPANGILFDRTLQALVDKVFTDLEELDRAKEDAFYTRLGIKRKPDPDDAPSGHTDAAASNSKAKRNRGAIDVEINFKLSPDCGPALPESLRLATLDKPYLKTCGRLKISQLKKYLSKKLQVERPEDIEVLCHGDALGSELSLQVSMFQPWLIAALSAGAPLVNFLTVSRTCRRCLSPIAAIRVCEKDAMRRPKHRPGAVV